MQSFRHAGDLGDILYSLPVIRHFGGGRLYIEAAGYTRQRLTPDKWAILTRLLKAQPYISDVIEWRGERADFNLNDFRATMNAEHREERFDIRKSLAERMCEAHQVPLRVLDAAWLAVNHCAVVADVIFARSLRYHGASFPWAVAYEMYRDKAVFVGTEDEHRHFCRRIGKVTWYKTADFLELAQAIAGAMLLVGNQSSPFAIAEGMKQNAILEVWNEGPNCIFRRSNVWHVWDLDIDLPDLKSLRRIIPVPRNHTFDENYYMRGAETGVSNYTDYHWLPEVTRLLAQRVMVYLNIGINDTLFDFGCARGYLVKALREAGRLAFGCDISAWAITNCDPDVTEFVSVSDAPKDDYDWIISKDVLEHIPMPALENTVRVLMARAIKGLFIIVPLAAEDGGAYIRPDDNLDVTHTVRWTLPTWMRFFRQIDAGFVCFGSYYLPDIKAAADPWPGSCGFLTLKRI